MIHIYTDGSARNNGKNNSFGGCGFVIFDQNNNLIDCYSFQTFENVTNNQMELFAILQAFRTIERKYKNNKVTIYSDSSYCINILTDWIYKWSMNNWRDSKGNEIKNFSYIYSLYKYYKKDFFICQINFQLVKGHNDNIGNQLADAVATKNKEKLIKIITENNIKIKI